MLIVMVHQPLKPPLHQTLEAYPGQTPTLSSTRLAIKSQITPWRHKLRYIPNWLSILPRNVQCNGKWANTVQRQLTILCTWD